MQSMFRARESFKVSEKRLDCNKGKATRNNFFCGYSGKTGGFTYEC